MGAEDVEVMGDNASREAGLIGGPEHAAIVLEEYDPGWVARFQVEKSRIAFALGARALRIEHVGSTSVPGLAAKPIIDILLVVQDASDEGAYVSALQRAGYVLRVREPEFYEHRMFRTPARDVHLHVFGDRCVEVERMLAFRDRLRAHPADRTLYEDTKRRLASRDWPTMQDYADAKTGVVEDILRRALDRSSDRV